ncbi:8-amino-7-oxononanoate synthase [Sphingomonas bacterium]|uniref:8-amino-7-oxononanoate synthase n=1 Tax=Sphingomonas bacterium TaxID=1895847 RepID=UPI0015765B81|nr:8-amino-7-oxononanoate synthase [Sphingomonas bacterium]
MSGLEKLEGELARLETAGRRRSLVPQRDLDFSSNDYLGLAGSTRLRQAAIDALGRGVATGSGGSRLLRGNCDEHERLEEEAARFFGSEAALFTGGGYGANTLLFSTLPQRGDLVVHDSLVHASAHEGMRLGRAETAPFAHNDVDAAADVITGWRRRGGMGTPWIAVESLYSMDGDRAPLAGLAELAQREDAMMLIDEAHATGVFGPGGRGLAAGLDGRENVVVLRTCGKALGCEGALILAAATVRDFIVNRGRGFIFSTAPSPLVAAIVRDALRCLGDEPDRRDRLRTLVRTAGRALDKLGLPASGSPIQPVIIGDDRRTMAVAAAMRAAGFDVRGVRPPTVPPGTSRLRLSFTLNIDDADIVALMATLRDRL